MSNLTTFEQFWIATGELPFDALTAKSSECFRLAINHSFNQHKVIRIQRTPRGSPEHSRLVTHHPTFGTNSADVTVNTSQIWLDEIHWKAMSALLDVADFWNLGENSRGGFDGGRFTLEAWNNGRYHQVTRWSPNAVVPGGELFSVVTDYLQRLEELAVFECSDELQDRYHGQNYVPRRRIYS